MNQSKTPDTNISWKEIRLSAPEPTPCKHYFEWVNGECRCRGCRMGLPGVVDIVDGKPM